MNDIQRTIMQKLHDTEIRYEVKIPLAIESGSRSWSFASPDSDYDCRFIYVHKKDWYLSVFDKKDVIEYAADPVFDVNGWDVKKVLLHIMKSNAVMFEWLSSNEVYIHDEHIANELNSLAVEFFNPIAVSYHYLCIAKNKFSEIISEDQSKLKKYFYILRPIANLNFIGQYDKMPYMEYDKTLAETECDNEIFAAIQELIEIKRASDESFKIPKNKLLIEYFQNEIDKFELYLKQMKHTKNSDYSRVDMAFKSIIEKVWHYG